MGDIKGLHIYGHFCPQMYVYTGCYVPYGGTEVIVEDTSKGDPVTRVEADKNIQSHSSKILPTKIQSGTILKGNILPVTMNDF